MPCPALFRTELVPAVLAGNQASRELRKMLISFAGSIVCHFGVHVSCEVVALLSTLQQEQGKTKRSKL